MMDKAMEHIKAWAYENLKGDPIIWFIVLVLSLFSILVVYSATGSLAYRMMGGDTEYYLFKHTFLTLLSLGAMWLAHRLDFRYYAGLAKIALFLSVPLLIYTWLFAPEVNDASRWITIPIINQAFQPSDLAKLALLLTIASMLAKRQQDIEDFQKSIIPVLVWIGVICGLIAMTNFSSAILLFLTCMVLLFIGRVPVKYFAILILIGVVTGAIAFSAGQRGATALSRVKEFYSGNVGYQSQQSFIAVASGGVFGKGPGQSEQRNYLPHPYSDFVYAIILEEYGMIGGVAVLLLYLALLYRGMRTAAMSDRTFGGLLAAGLAFAIVIQALVHMGVVVGLGPVTGQTLPLISMGGTSQLFTGIALGIILSVSRGDLEQSGNKVSNQMRQAA
jgi:cell division protein FtsW